MRTIESGPFVKIAKDSYTARAIILAFIGQYGDNYTVDYSESDYVFNVYDNTLDGILVLIVNVKGE